LESVLPVETNSANGSGCTTSCAFTTSDFFKKKRRTNSGIAMTDSLPAAVTPGLVNGTRIVIANADATATDTITAGSGTTMASGGASDTIGPGRDVAYEFDLPNTQWRGAYNTRTALLGPNNLSDLANAAAARGSLGLGSLATQNPGTGLANSGGSTNLQPAQASTIGGVKPDGITTTVDGSGTITAIGAAATAVDVGGATSI
jgi:hypothetical protein